MPENITIVGGGLAGLTLGIGLRRLGVPVTVWEVGAYPRHRVCGEFISGEGQNSLARLGLLDGLHAAEAYSAKSVAFLAGSTMVVEHPLPEAALCISRFELDQWLARQFQRLGGELRQGARWCGEFGKGIVRASGRRAEPVTNGWRLFGLKAHARGVSLDADLEMHFVPSGYVGLCKLASGEVNVCGLFRSKTTVPDLAQRWRDWLGGPAASLLHSRLAVAKFDEDSFCSVAGLCLRPRCAIQRNECCIGDALTMTPPVTGNGMSMAFESAELAIESLAEFSRGELTWAGATQEIASRCDERFAERLRWAAWLQRALFQPHARPVLMFLAARSKWLWRGIFKRTR
jgi:flavin-dependent dehydrogenase